jgi:hypothetical protein
MNIQRLDKYSKNRMCLMRKICKYQSKKDRLISYTYKTVEAERYLSIEQLVDRIVAYHELAKINDRKFIRKYVVLFREKFPKKSKKNEYNKSKRNYKVDSKSFGRFFNSGPMGEYAQDAVEKSINEYIEDRDNIPEEW